MPSVARASRKRIGRNAPVVEGFRRLYERAAASRPRRVRELLAPLVVLGDVDLARVVLVHLDARVALVVPVPRDALPEQVRRGGRERLWARGSRVSSGWRDRQRRQCEDHCDCELCFQSKSLPRFPTGPSVRSITNGGHRTFRPRPTASFKGAYQVLPLQPPLSAPLPAPAVVMVVPQV